MPIDKEEEIHQRTHHQHAIPQHIAAFKFRLIGQFTLKEFAYVGGFGLLAWIIFASKLFFLIKLPAAFFLASAGFVFAFVPVSGRSLDKMLVNFFKSVSKPTQRVWIKRGGLPDFFQAGFGKPEVKNISKKTSASRQVLEEYLSKFKPKPASADVAETAFISKLDWNVTSPPLPAQTAAVTQPIINSPQTVSTPIHQSFHLAQAKPTSQVTPSQPQVTPTPNMTLQAEPKPTPVESAVQLVESAVPVVTSKNSPEKTLKAKKKDVVPKKPETEKQVKIEGLTKPVAKQNPNRDYSPVAPFLQNLPADPPISNPPPITEPLADDPPVNQNSTIQPQTEKQSIAEKPTAEEIETLAGITVAERQPTKSSVVPIAGTVNFVERQVITVPSPPAVGGKPIIIPPVGQIRVRKLHSEPNISEDYLSRVRGEKKFEISPALQARLGLLPTSKEEGVVTADTFPKTTPKTPTSAQKFIASKLTHATESAITPPTTLAKPKRMGAKKKSEEKAKVVIVEPSENLVTWEKLSKTRAFTPQEKIGPKIIQTLPISTPTQPNLIAGIAKDVRGHLLEGVIMIVNNENGAPVRALKTNLLGQFSITTPLPKGKYTIEAEKEGYKFSIIEFETKGEIIQPIEVVSQN